LSTTPPSCICLGTITASPLTVNRPTLNPQTTTTALSTQSSVLLSINATVATIFTDNSIETAFTSQLIVAIASAVNTNTSEIVVSLDVVAKTISVSLVDPLTMVNFEALIAQRGFSFSFSSQTFILSPISTTTTTIKTTSHSYLVHVTFNSTVQVVAANTTLLQLFIDNLKSVIARAINDSSSNGIVIDVNLSTFQVTITFPSPAQATAFRNLVNSGAFVFNFHGQTLVATLVVTTTVAPTTAPACPTVGVNTGNWAPWSTSCGYASRVLNTLNCVAATPFVYGSYNPYSACNVSCIQSASYNSRSIRCPCVGTAVRNVNDTASLCGGNSTCPSGSFCDVEPSGA
jgi:hypothetical protein